MARIYEIDVHAYPKQYRIKAHTEADAIQQARDMFSNDTNGQSVYELKVIDRSEQL